jgi:transcriptional regulator with XRE-family HTH domain
MLKIGKNIRRVRELRNYTQEYMAEQMELAQSSYSNLEKDLADIKLSQIDKIAKVLDIDVIALLQFKGEKMLDDQKEEDEDALKPLTNGEKQLYEELLAVQKERITFLEDLLKTYLKAEV